MSYDFIGSSRNPDAAPASHTMTPTLLQTAPGNAHQPVPVSRYSVLPPAIILGGGANALSVARSLGKIGVRVYAINFPDEYVCLSRYVTRLPVPSSSNYAQEWAGYLLGCESDWLRGAVLLAASDAGLLLIARHREQLASRFVLDESNVEAQQMMLNKLATYQAAAAAGVPTPKFWLAPSRCER